MTGKPLTDDQLLCTNPFEWFEIHQGGSVFLCCPAWMKTPIGNILTGSLEEIWNGPVARRLRKGILDGTFGPCNKKRCPRLATGHAPVMPLAAVADAPLRKALRSGETALPFGPRKINICFDRSCNLACPSCRNDFSRPTEAERQRVEEIIARIEKTVASSAEKLTLSGFGDPFGSPALRAMLQNVRPVAWPHLRRIHLHTNGLLWDAPLWGTMTAIHPLVRSAEISVDAATPATYSVNRRGGDFRRLRSNLDFIATLPLDLKLSFVVQANNFREIPAFIALAAEWGASVYFSQLVNWGTFSRQEFQQRAVHLREHPEHATLIAVLAQVAGHLRVDLGNLTRLLQTTVPL